MITVGILVRLEAKPGKEEELAALLMQGLELANRRRDPPCGSHFDSEEEASPSSMLSQMKQADKLISTDPLPKRSRRRLPIYLQGLRRFNR
jgi:hypothetical protein